MRLKVFMVPTLVIFSLVLLIGYIRPGISDLEKKNSELQLKSDRLASIETIIRNASSLTGSLDDNKEIEQFASRYIPKNLDQDRTIDTFNFLAAQSGLSITAMRMTIMPKPVVDGGTVDELTADASLSDTFSKPVAESYTASVTVSGSYENIKEFFGHLFRADRLYKVSSFEISSDKSQGQGDEQAAANDNLSGTFVAQLDYFPERPMTAAISAPIFQNPQIDFSSIKNIFDRATNTIPVLGRPQSGRPNPFR